MRRNLWPRLAIVAAVVLASIWYLYPPKKTINLGLDLQGGIHLVLGVDMFDCALPTRNARNGQCFTAAGPLTIKQARYARDPAPLDEACRCYGCRRFSRAYLRHLFMSEELLAYRLLTLHNVTFFLGLVRAMREAIVESRFEAFRARFFDGYAVS